ncbi:hypothetical protein CIW49_19615 [Mycolicibacterium sp. P1-18]|uniref:hypothetical protein n=1 Tax=Mycolicibacterium sp. P1-18 TaxID=2024615 RepID=UPI0011F1DEA8|nr:hypothetical protein [Mycolicibacterium sp. P1-18]KAA0096855.1 hypothetical protein CIW49_19615 [Mycolicibacterium sp. P1-18]
MFGPLCKAMVVACAVIGLVSIPGAPEVHAEPPGFPDLAAFTEAPLSVDYSRPDKSANGYSFFRTPDGLNCMAGSLVRCSGSLPGLPTAQFGDCASVRQSHEQAEDGGPFAFAKDSTCRDEPDQLLDVGQKLTLVSNYTTTCVVGANRLTACIRAGHGFVLQPSGSWVF